MKLDIHVYRPVPRPKIEAILITEDNTDQILEYIKGILGHPYPGTLMTGFYVTRVLGQAPFLMMTQDHLREYYERIPT